MRNSLTFEWTNRILPRLQYKVKFHIVFKSLKNSHFSTERNNFQHSWDSVVLFTFWKKLTDFICSQKWDEFEMILTLCVQYGIKNVKKFSSKHTVRNLHYLSKNSTLISREKLSNCIGWKVVKMLRFWTF